MRAEHLPSLESFLVDYMCAGEHGLPCIITGQASAAAQLSCAACALSDAFPAGNLRLADFDDA